MKVVPCSCCRLLSFCQIFHEKFIEKFINRRRKVYFIVDILSAFFVELYAISYIISINVSKNEKPQNIEKALLSRTIYDVLLSVFTVSALTGVNFSSLSMRITKKKREENNFRNRGGSSLKFINFSERAYVSVFYHLLPAHC